MPMEVKNDEERWNDVLDMTNDDLLDYLNDMYDTDHGFTPDSSHTEILSYVIRKHHDELEGYLEEYLETSEDEDYSPMHPNETKEEFFDHEDH